MKLNGVDFNAEWVAKQDVNAFIDRHRYAHYTKMPLEQREQALRQVHELCQKECGCYVKPEKKPIPELKEETGKTPTGDEEKAPAKAKKGAK